MSEAMARVTRFNSLVEVKSEKYANKTLRANSHRNFDDACFIKELLAEAYQAGCDDTAILAWNKTFPFEPEYNGRG